MRVLANTAIEEVVEAGAIRTTAAGSTGQPDAVAGLRGVLADAAAGGAVLVGPAGSGRRVVFDEALEQLDPKPPVVHLTGSQYAAQMRHGVLSFMLSQLDFGTIPTRHELVHRLADLLCQNNQRTVVTLGSPAMIDPESAAILAQLTAMKKIRLVAICEQLAELPGDLLSLHRSGQFTRVTVHSMGVRRTRDFLEKELGSPLSMFASAALWHLTNSNRDLIRQLVRELVADGKLRLQADCWVFAPGALRIGPTLRAYATRATCGLDAMQRKVLALLALGGPATSEDLLHAGLADHISGLRVRGLVTVGEKPLGLVRLTVPLLGHLLRERTDEAERLELESTLVRLHGDPEAARVLAEVTAMRELGNYEALVAVVEEYVEAGGATSEAWTTDGYRQLRILAHVVDSLVILGRSGRASASLLRARENIGAALAEQPSEYNLLRAWQTLRIMKARMELAEGRPSAVEDVLNGRLPVRAESKTRIEDGTPSCRVDPQATLWASEALYFQAMSVQAEAWAMTTRQNDALRLARRIGTDIEGLRITGILDQVMDPSECAQIECTLLRVQLLAGEWRGCAGAARRLADGQYADPRAIAYAETILGVLQALSADTDCALGILLPALQQQSINADSTERAAVEAAVTFCLADQGRDQEAVELLLDAPSVLDRLLPLNFYSWAAEVQSSLALARLGESVPARNRLMALAEKALRGGCSTLAMHALAVVLRLGGFEVAPRLEELAANHPGQAANCFGRLARCIEDADSAVLCEALEELIDLGQILYAVDDANAFIEAMGPKDRRRVAVALSRARQEEKPGQPVTSREDVTVAKPAWLDDLTKREAQIALHVISGMTNAAIARQSGVSVRTVEGHLYQVYSKLHVRNRQELTALDRASRSTVGVR